MQTFFKRVAAVITILIVLVAAYYIYDNFREKSVPEKIAAIIHLEDRRDHTIELETFLSDVSPEVRARAALAIGRIGNPKAGNLLYELVKTDVSDVSSTAAFGLGLTGDSRYADDLLDIAFDAPSSVGAAAVEAAGRLADSTTIEIPVMLTAFLDHPSPEVRTAACYAIFRADGKDQAPALMQFIAEETDEEVQVAALFALTRLGVVEAYPVYESFLADADPFVRATALRGLALSESKEAQQYLAISLNDNNMHVVAQAIRGLAKLQTAEAKNNLLKKLNRMDDEKLLEEVITGLIRQENFVAAEDIRELIYETSSPNIIATSIQYLAHAEGDRAVMLIDSLMRDPRVRIRVACAEAFGVIGSDKNIARLAILFSDPEEQVRASAFSELIELDSTNVNFYLDKALADSGEIMPVLAIDYISGEKLKSYLPRLRMMSDSQKTNPMSVDVRRSLLSCAAAFITDTVKDSSAMRILINSIMDNEYIVRREAAVVYDEKLGENRYGMIRSAPTRISLFSIERAVDKYATGNPVARVETNKGAFTFELRFDTAPLTVMHFIELAEDDFYEGVIFHRVILNFVAQGGDPTGTGWGGPPYMIRDEYSDLLYTRGTVGIATSGKDTGGSQFFITHTPQPHLNGRYTIFGQVFEGMDVVDKLVVGDTIVSVSIEQGNKL